MPMILPILLAAASAALPPCTTGTWAMKAGDRTIFRIEIGTASTGPSATWVRPEQFDTDGETFARITGPTVRRPARSIKSVDGGVELSFDDPAPGATPDIVDLRCAGTGHLAATYQGTSFEPFDLVDAKAERATPLGPWAAGRTYTRVITRPTNPEMTAIFDADQADRQADHIDWSIVGPADRKRQSRTQALLDTGALQSGDDFYHAAFVFQHGRLPDDYLKAHLLAMVATARGNTDAVWIASATLDRYLHAIGKPQVLGTQYSIPKGAPATQEPYDRALLSDPLRKALHVPTLAEQEQRRRQFTAEASAAKTP
jgi:hypothetical protein